MLRDRDYMREPEGSGQSLTIGLVIALLVIFVAQACLMYYGHLRLIDWFGLSLSGFKNHRYWQLLTFQFLHEVPMPWHVLFNCLGLYFFGRSVEETLGKKKFLTIYFGGGLLGGALQLLVTWILPNYPENPVVGASAGIMSLFGTYAMLFPMRDLTIFLYFIPVTIRVIWLFWFLLLFSAFCTIIPIDYTASAAHLGGILTGVAYIRWGHRFTGNLEEWSLLKRRKRTERMIKAATIRPSVISPLRRRSLPEANPELPSDEFISKEVDPILDKISAHGIQSLTERERAILQAARAKMSKR